MKLKVVFVVLIFATNFFEVYSQETEFRGNYILRKSYLHSTHGVVESFWSLSITNDSLRDFEVIEIENKRFKVINLMVPTTSLDIYLCCEKKNIDLITTGFPKDDYIGEIEKKYTRLFNLNYVWKKGKIKLLKSKGLHIQKKELKDTTISFFKLNNNTCLCTSDIVYKRSPYTNQIGMIGEEISYSKFSDKEKEYFSFYAELFLEKVW